MHTSFLFWRKAGSLLCARHAGPKAENVIFVMETKARHENEFHSARLQERNRLFRH